MLHTMLTLGPCELWQYHYYTRVQSLDLIFIVQQAQKKWLQNMKALLLPQRVVTIARQHSGAVCVVTAEVMKNGCDPSVFCKMDRSRCCSWIITCPTCTTYINYYSVQRWMCVVVFLMRCVCVSSSSCTCYIVSTKFRGQRFPWTWCFSHVSEEMDSRILIFKKIFSFSSCYFLLDFSPSFFNLCCLPVYAVDRKSIGGTCLGA